MAKNNTKPSPEQSGEGTQITPEAVAQLQSDLAKATADLEAANALVQEKDEQLAKATADLEAANALVQEKDEQLAKANADLETANAVIKQMEIADKAEATVVEKKAEKKLLIFSHQGKRYTFSHKAPQNLSVDGVVYSQEELIKNNELMVSLIVGGNPFVKLL